ncbi:hypothetical protein BX600DRAFT_473397 [Xylariales sp. PMI_506]|nr:hypothetical protein BX600DRAFT_473397 [Xylariales sp. PMI_506]
MAFYYFAYPERYQTTTVRDTYPERHWLLEHQRHQIGDAVHNLIHPFDEDIRTPHTDIRETVDKYYIDVELPGLKCGEDYSLRWTNQRTMLIEAQIKRPQIDIEQIVTPRADTESGPGDQKAGAGAGPGTAPYHFLTKERRVGTFARAFSFTVDVDHDKVLAHLYSGLLRLTVCKKEPDQLSTKQITVEHRDGITRN